MTGNSLWHKWTRGGVDVDLGIGMIEVGKFMLLRRVAVNASRFIACGRELYFLSVKIMTVYR